MKARKVKGLDPAAPLAGNASRIVNTRLGELKALAASALENGTSEQLHDTRIAAKRLRYVLEATGFCFGEAGSEALAAAREIQGILGDLHDCDELLPEIDEHVQRLRTQDAEVVGELSDGAGVLDAALAAKAPNRTAYRGLNVLSVHVSARRHLELDRFSTRWRELSGAGVWDRLESAASQLRDTD